MRKQCLNDFESDNEEVVSERLLSQIIMKQYRNEFKSAMRKQCLKDFELAHEEAVLE